MSRRVDIIRHLRSLDEIREILNAMKTLAYMETRKLAGFLQAQQKVVSNMEEVGEDFHHFFPNLVPEDKTGLPVYLLVGTERGFCGPVNRDLLQYFAGLAEQATESTSPRLIIVGRKLHVLLENDSRVEAYITGASVSEDITSILPRLVNELAVLQQRHGSLILHGLFQDLSGEVVVRKLLPMHQTPARARADTDYAFPPLLHLPPLQFFLEFTEQYLFASLHELLYTSLMAESHRRIVHLEGAVRHLDEESRDLYRRSNMLRQEEITEEIEVILLSAGSVAGTEIGRAARKRRGFP